MGSQDDEDCLYALLQDVINHPEMCRLVIWYLVQPRLVESGSEQWQKRFRTYEVQEENDCFRLVVGGFIGSNDGLQALFLKEKTQWGAWSRNLEQEHFIRRYMGYQHHPSLCRLLYVLLEALDPPKIHTLVFEKLTGNRALEFGLKSLHFETGLQLWIELLHAVQWLHDHNVIHTTINLHNLLIVLHPEPRVVFLNLGYARIRHFEPWQLDIRDTIVAMSKFISTRCAPVPNTFLPWTKSLATKITTTGALSRQILEYAAKQCVLLGATI